MGVRRRRFAYSAARHGVSREPRGGGGAPLRSAHDKPWDDPGVARAQPVHLSRRISAPSPSAVPLSPPVRQCDNGIATMRQWTMRQWQRRCCPRGRQRLCLSAAVGAASHALAEGTRRRSGVTRCPVPVPSAGAGSSSHDSARHCQAVKMGVTCRVTRREEGVSTGRDGYLY